MPPVKEMTKDTAILKVLLSFRENFPDSLVVATYLGKIGYVHNFMISVSGNKEDD
jgi:hypothetical protein